MGAWEITDEQRKRVPDKVIGKRKSRVALSF